MLERRVHANPMAFTSTRIRPRRVLAEHTDRQPADCRSTEPPVPSSGSSRRGDITRYRTGLIWRTTRSDDSENSQNLDGMAPQAGLKDLSARVYTLRPARVVIRRRLYKRTT